MRKSVLVFSVLCLLILSTSFVLAQQGGGNRRGQGQGGPGGPGGFGQQGGEVGIGMLLQNADVKAHLGLTEDQVKQLEKINEETRAARPQGGRQGEGQPSEAERQQRRAEAEKRRNEVQVKINAVLTPEQQAKYKTLPFQLSEGLQSPFLRVRMLEALDLTAEQKEKLQAFEEQRNQAGRGERGGADFRNMSQEERQKRFQERAEAGRKISEQMAAVLTAQQKEKAAKLTEEGKELREKVRPPRGEGQRRGRGGDGDGA